MKYCVDPSADEPILLVNKHIGYDEKEGQGIDGSLFQAELLALDNMGKKRIQVWINSPGGIVMDGYSIYNAILKSKTKVDTYNVGIAASIAAVIFQAGRNRIMADYSLLMYHNPYGGEDTELEKMKKSLATMIAQRTGKSEAEVLAIMSKTTWMTASEAFNSGFCDTIETSSEHNKRRAVVPSSDIKAMWTESDKVLNSIFFQTNNIKMTKVTNKLGLNAEANEEAILSAIASIENKKAEAEDSLKKMEDKMAKMEDEMDEMKAKYAEAKKKAEDADEAKKKAEDEAEDSKAKNMIESFVSQGRIKADAVNSWVASAKTLGLDEVKNLIEALPMHKTANKINVSETANTAVLTNVVASTMADLRTKNKI
jgi:ATP-dependent Clp endopeptidase proteolytic subunit ClpP